MGGITQALKDLLVVPPLWGGLLSQDPRAVHDPLTVELTGPVYSRPVATGTMIFHGIQVGTQVAAIGLFDAETNGRLRFARVLDEPVLFAQGGYLTVPAGTVDVPLAPPGAPTEYGTWSGGTNGIITNNGNTISTEMDFGRTEIEITESPYTGQTGQMTLAGRVRRVSTGNNAYNRIKWRIDAVNEGGASTQNIHTTYLDPGPAWETWVPFSYTFTFNAVGGIGRFINKDPEGTARGTFELSPP